METKTMLVYKFDTAWSPPVSAIVKASEQHPRLELTLRFVEEMVGFAGVIRCIGGEVVAAEELTFEAIGPPEETWYSGSLSGRS